MHCKSCWPLRSSTRTIAVACISGLLAGLGPRVHAQSANGQAPASAPRPVDGKPSKTEPAILANDWRVVSARQPGEVLVIKLKDGNSRKGKFKSATDDGLVLEMKNKELSLGRDEIASVAVLSKKSMGKATVVGLAVGGGIGAGAGAGIAAAVFGNPNGFCCPRGRSAAVGAGVGGAFGVLAGGLIGFASGRFDHKETVIYRSVPSK